MVARRSRSGRKEPQGFTASGAQKAEAFMSRREILLFTGIWLAACLALGCIPALSTRSSRAVYPGGVSFFANGQGAYKGAYYSLQWQAANANPPPPCPLVLHLPGGDLNAHELADPKKLQDRGWVESFQDNGRVTVEYKWEERAGDAEKTLAQVTLTGGVLTRVLLRTTDSAIASIDDKRVELPIADRQLEQLMGKPQRVEVTDVFQGKVAP
jgi:hypothetical protein